MLAALANELEILRIVATYEVDNYIGPVTIRCVMNSFDPISGAVVEPFCCSEARIIGRSRPSRQ
jgi:hypothetical protein